MKTTSEKAAWERGYALLVIHPLRHVRTAIEAGPVQLDRLCRDYRHPLAADLWRVRTNEHLRSDEEANHWLVAMALSMLSDWIEVDRNDVRLKPGVAASDLTYRGNPIPPIVEEQSLFDEPFNRDRTSGTFADNIRARGPDDLDELRESMRTFGWIPYHPAIVDEHDVVIVGHRRLKVAEELSIPIREDKEIVRMNFSAFGSADTATAERLKLALASNLGNKPFTAKDRKKIAMRLYGDENWTMERIGELLKVHKSTISKDLAELLPPQQLNRTEKRGRPKAVQRDKALDAIRELEALGKPITEAGVAARAGVGTGTANKALSIHRAGQQELVIPDDDPLRLFAQALLDAQPRPMLRNDVVSVIVGLQRRLDEDAEQ